MTLVERLLHHPHAVIGLSLVGVLAGVLAYLSLPINLFPDTNRPTVSVVTRWPGATSLSYQFNLVTLTAVIVAVGMLVDDAIVVIENIERRMRDLGESGLAVAARGTAEVWLPVLSGTVGNAIARGAERDAAILEAVRLRTRPILMTAGSTIVGMLPIALEWAVGIERLSPLAVVAVGGLVTGTFLTLFVVPVLLSWCRCGGRRNRPRGRGDPGAAR